MKNAVIYIHGQGGNAKEADYYKKFFDSEHLIIGFDYKSRFSWEAQLEFPDFFDLATSQYNKIYFNSQQHWRLLFHAVFGEQIH